MVFIAEEKSMLLMVVQDEREEVARKALKWQ